MVLKAGVDNNYEGSQLLSGLLLSFGCHIALVSWLDDLAG